MAEKLTDEQVRHVAMLARLKLDDAQVHHMAEQLSAVLDYMDQLNELDVDGVEPMAHPLEMTNKLRPDEPGACLSIEQVLANAPQADPPFFRVPKILGEGSGA